MKRFKQYFTIQALIVIGFTTIISTTLAGNIYLSQTTNNLNNPHKGFMLWGTDYQDGAPNNYYGSTVFHIYVPWREIETADQVFDWNSFEANHLSPILDDYTNATFVLRPVADYPDGENSGITLFYGGTDLTRDFPAFLTNVPLNIAAYPYASCDGDGPGITPDWNNPAMITQMVEFIQALGTQYDGDIRITAIQTGLLGLWGEWHQSGCTNNEPGSIAKAAVRDVYVASFVSTPVQTRYPRDPDATGVDFGFHEDYFPSFTGPNIYGFPDADDSGDWNMYYCFQNITTGAVDNWQSNPISGESPNNNQKETWFNDFNDVMTVIEDFHFSFLGPAGGHQLNGHQVLFNEMKRKLGYNLHINYGAWPDTVRLGKSFDVTLVMTNSGSAPCYHNFPVELAICSTNGTPVWTDNFDFNLKNIIPGILYSNTTSFTVDAVPAGEWSVRIGIIDPRFNKPGVRLQNMGEDTYLRYEVGNIILAPHLPTIHTIVSHNNVDISSLAEDKIIRAKEKLHIAYGHTSHGSQLTTGMNGLVAFANGGGKGMNFPTNIFAWNNGGSSGALDLHDYAMGGDVGYWPAWYNNTINYLDNPANADVNVIIWSWCGQMPGKYTSGTLTNEYLAPMSLLEEKYPNVIFVYMTGHVDIWNDTNQKAACQVIRNYCSDNNKVLYDFADIEHYNPDGAYFEFVSDSCNYYSGPGTGQLGNWATEWQNANTINVDWYSCSSAHSQPLNANQKAYAAWALWCKLAADIDRDGIPDSWEEQHGGICYFAGLEHDTDNDGANDTYEYQADTNPTNAASLFSLSSISNIPPVMVRFQSSSNRCYSLQCRPSLITGKWSLVEAQTNIPGNGGEDSLSDTNTIINKRFYRLEVQLP